VTRVFHVLTESEPFSQKDGGAISRWAANVALLDGAAVICAPAADRSWCIDESRVRELAGWRRYKTIKDAVGQRVPWFVRRRLIASAFRGLLKELRPDDVLWVHNRPEYVAALRSVSAGRGVRIVLHMHNSHLVKWIERYRRAPGADLYVFVSRFLEQEVLSTGMALGRTEVLYNGADASVFYPRPPERRRAHVPTVLFAGRLVPEKGLHVLLQAMKEVHRRGVALNGRVVGAAGFGDVTATDYVKYVHAMAPPNVHFGGYCTGAKMGDMFRSADIFCLPSCWQDPFPLSVLEAMASGLPVVATRSGGIPEALAGGGGVLVERDNVCELATALADLACRPEERERIASAGYSSFQKSFTWQSVVERCQSLANSLVLDTKSPVSTVETAKVGR
jgi:spore coat protein SA